MRLCRGSGWRDLTPWPPLPRGEGELGCSPLPHSGGGVGGGGERQAVAKVASTLPKRTSSPSLIGVGVLAASFWRFR